MSDRLARLAPLARLSAALVAVLAPVWLGACSPQALLVRQAADALASQGSASEDDLVLAHESAAFYLKLSESVLAQSPGHRPLAEAVAGGFTQYAYAFVAAEADRLEASDAQAAQRLRQRAARLYDRARQHAMRALEAQHPGLTLRLREGPAAAQRALEGLGPDDVGLLYWAAAAWGSSIALRTDRPERVADLPQVVRLAQRAWALAPDHGDGAVASLMGTLELARPGGNAQQAGQYFDRAMAAAGGRSAGPWVARAEALALPAGDRSAFEALLRQALAIAAAHPDLPNQVMRDRAQWLLATVDDRF